MSTGAISNHTLGINASITVNNSLVRNDSLLGRQVLLKLIVLANIQQSQGSRDLDVKISYKYRAIRQDQIKEYSQNNAQNKRHTSHPNLKNRTSHKRERSNRGRKMSLLDIAKKMGPYG